MIFNNGDTYLIKTDDWFPGPDGLDYNKVYGKVEIVKAEDLLGLKPHNSANWFAVVGGIQIIAGCRIHYATCLNKRPAVMQNVLDLSEK